MFTLIASRELLRAASIELPALIGAWVLAEAFYKFHSFTLECMAFLATWFLFGWAGALLRKK